MTRVAVTARSFRNSPGAHHDLLNSQGWEIRASTEQRPLTEPEMIALVSGCDGLIAGNDPVTRSVLLAGPLRAVARYGAGTDNIDLDAAAALDVAVTTTGDANAASVAELTIGLLLCLARRIPQMDRSMRAGDWSRSPGIELGGRTLGIIGLGAIGRQVARRAQCLGVQVIAHDPFVGDAEVPLVPLEDLLRAADAVSLHVPLTPATTGLIGPEEIALMPRGSLLINTCRGGVVEEDALADALETRQLAGAAIDCFEQEPLPPDHRLTGIETAILTPHCGAATADAAVRAGSRAVESLITHLAMSRP